ncbi:hypothetical protein [Hufsiella ginkgonis]|uniref:Uncharacterized protein n=1 Tax=Hufsiella ginkgonis TaxID=2695274 RepID=A0A7K1XUW6_9SPHI|nr:hypothetical protein [Hufsiella ginkgonis]MXV14803.1 hypothetical protein [Hufsiella ginkgonis]
MQNLPRIHSQVSPFMDVDLFMRPNDLSKSYSNHELAAMINGQAYERALQRIAEFRDRCEQTLLSFKERVWQTESDFESLSSQERRERPGSAPPSWGNMTAEERDSYNQKVTKYNNQVDFHNRLVDQTNRARERYEDAVSRLNEKRAELEEQVQQKEQDLTPALDQDILSVLGKLQQLAYDHIHNKNNPFSGFMLGFLTKKVYVFLYDRVWGTESQRAATEIFKKLNDETEMIFSRYPAPLRQGLIQTAGLIHSCYKLNEVLLAAIRQCLNGLPHNTCVEYQPEADRFLTRSTEFNYEYRHLIDPIEIDNIRNNMSVRMTEIGEDISQLKAFILLLEPVFEQILNAIRFNAGELTKMTENKEKLLDPIGRDLYFALGVFDEYDQERFLNKQQPFLNDVEREIRSSLHIGVPLTAFIRHIEATELLILTAKETVSSDIAMQFYLKRDKLSKKLEELEVALGSLSTIITEVDELPKQQSEAFRKKISLLLNLSVIPLINIGVLAPVWMLVSRYLPAFGSNNPYYSELRISQAKKLKSYSFIHGGLAISFFLLELFGIGPIPWLFPAIGLSYMVSGGALFSRAGNVGDAR